MRGRLGLILAAAAVAILLLMGRSLSALIVDQGWYAALDASGVWREKVLATVVLKGVAWLLGSAFVFANLWAVRSAIRAIIVTTNVGDLELEEMIPARRLLPPTVAASALVGALLTLALNDWTVLSMVWRGEAFREYEGFFQRDLGFYVYWLPFETAVYTWALISIVVVTALVTVLYTITRHLRLEDRQLVAGTHARRHLTTLGTLVLLLLAWSYRIDAYELLLWGSGFDGLFNRVDHQFTLRIDLLLAVATFAAALVVLRAGWLGQVRAAFITVTLVLVGALVLRQAAPGVVASGGYVGVAATRDRDYEGTRALFTRRAYNVEGMQFLEADTAPNGSVSEYARDVVWWDASVLDQLQSGTEATHTSMVQPVWQHGPEGPQATVVTRSTTQTPVWDVRVVPGVLRTTSGAPLVARHRALGSAIMAEPLVAPGLNEHKIVAASPAAPSRANRDRAALLAGASPFADRSVAAAPLVGVGARIAHAWATRDASLLGESPTGERRAVVMHRDVRTRIQRLVPALAQGQDIAPIVHEGRLLWAVSLYAASEYYPLTVRFQLAGAPRSYFREAGTALVDANTGRVRIVAADTPDPIARTAFKRIAALIIRDTDLPIDVRDQLPIATDGALAQLRAFTRVGSRRTGNVGGFVPDSVLGSAPLPVARSELSGASISWSVPLVNDADQLLGVVEASGGRRRVTYWRPLAEPQPRWSVLTSLLGAELDSAAIRTRRESDGPVTLGALRVLVRGGRPLLVRPAYTSDASGLHLTAIALATDSMVRAGANLDELLGGSGAATAPGYIGATPADRQAEARRLYDAMQAALRDGDWLRFGMAFDSLGRMLDRVP